MRSVCRDIINGDYLLPDEVVRKEAMKALIGKAYGRLHNSDIQDFAAFVSDIRKVILFGFLTARFDSSRMLHLYISTYSICMFWQDYAQVTPQHTYTYAEFKLKMEAAILFDNATTFMTTGSA